MPQIVKIEKFPPSRTKVKDREERVTYRSENYNDETSFVAHSAPNSVHAAQLAQIALAVQSDQKPKSRKGFLGSPMSYFQRQVEWTGATPQDSQTVNSGSMIQSNTTPESRSHQQILPTQSGSTDADAHQLIPVASYIPVAGKQSVMQPSSISQPTTYTQAPAEHQSMYTATATATNPPVVQAEQQQVIYVHTHEATRHSSENKTAYSVRTGNGKLYVSAPSGSNEAQMFDEVAKASSKSKKGKERGSRAAVVERRGKRERI